MFTLYRHGDFHRKSSPENYALVLSPRSALELATQYYDLNPRDHSMLGFREAPRRLSGNPTWTRASTGYADPVYDYVKQDLRIGWFIGIDLMGEWNPQKNPFYVDENGDLVCPQSHHYHAWFVQEIMNGYRDAVHARNGMKARPTQRLRNYGGAGEPEQHAQAGKTINSKAAGRLLAAGGIYNGNIEGFHETAQQLGGDAPAGYDQVMDNKGLIIAGASVAAGLGLGRLGAASELSELENLHVLGKVEGEYSMIKPGPLSNRFAETFSGGVYKEITLSENTVFYRGGQDGTNLGRFFSYEKPQGIIQTRIDKAVLPEWPDGSKSIIDSYFEVEIPAGSKVYVGNIGYQTDLYSGGSEQVLIPAPWDIPGVKTLDFGGLK